MQEHLLRIHSDTIPQCDNWSLASRSVIPEGLTFDLLHNPETGDGHCDGTMKYGDKQRSSAEKQHCRGQPASVQKAIIRCNNNSELISPRLINNVYENTRITTIKVI